MNHTNRNPQFDCLTDLLMMNNRDLENCEILVKCKANFIDKLIGKA
jgi:hypothetical protein